MSGPQKFYRIYCYNRSAKLVTADFVAADSDEEAIAAVEAAGYGTKCEIWEGDRLVAQLEEERRQA